MVYEYLKTKIFSRDANILPKCIEHQIFLDPHLQQLGVFQEKKTKKKTAFPKNAWIQH